MLNSPPSPLYVAPAIFFFYFFLLPFLFFPLCSRFRKRRQSEPRAKAERTQSGGIP